MNPAGPKRFRTHLSSTLIPAVSYQTQRFRHRGRGAKTNAARGRGRALHPPLRDPSSVAGSGRRVAELGGRGARPDFSTGKRFSQLHSGLKPSVLGLTKDASCIFWAPLGSQKGPQFTAVLWSLLVTLGHFLVTCGYMTVCSPVSLGWPALGEGSRNFLPLRDLSRVWPGFC